MRLLLDECVPQQLRHFLTAHECATAQDCGWEGIANGELIQRASQRFDVFVTADQNMRYQQNLSGSKIAILELSTNNVRRIRAATPQILAVLASLLPGEIRRLDIP
jgi:predicted nuclease of predicted toxin-antitoxin system